jgi:hypothetical protein
VQTQPIFTLFTPLTAVRYSTPSQHRVVDYDLFSSNGFWGVKNGVKHNHH